MNQKNKDLIVISRNNFKVVQYKIDTNNYFYKGKELLPANGARSMVQSNNLILKTMK